MKDSITDMLDEIAAELKAGDSDVQDWLRDQLEEAGASDVVVTLVMGVIERLAPEAPAGSDAARRLVVRPARRLLH